MPRPTRPWEEDPMTSRQVRRDVAVAAALCKVLPACDDAGGRGGGYCRAMAMEARTADARGAGPGPERECRP